MNRRILTVILSVVLLASMLIAPVGACAASREKVNILSVTVDGARLRSGPSSSYEILGSATKGAKVFYLNKTKNSFAYVRTAKGALGYIYQGYLKNYGVAYKDQVYYATKKAKVYKKASTGSKRVTTLSKNQHVIVYQVKGNWAYIKTLGGTGGYMKKSALKKAK